MRGSQENFKLTQVEAQALERLLNGFFDHYYKYYPLFYFR
jgi:hypothetical protein